MSAAGDTFHIRDGVVYVRQDREPYLEPRFGVYYYRTTISPDRVREGQRCELPGGRRVHAFRDCSYQLPSGAVIRQEEPYLAGMLDGPRAGPDRDDQRSSDVGGGVLPEFEERVDVPCPKVRKGTETRWHLGQWQKYTRRDGWVSL